MAHIEVPYKRTPNRRLVFSILAAFVVIFFAISPLIVKRMVASRLARLSAKFGLSVQYDGISVWFFRVSIDNLSFSSKISPDYKFARIQKLSVRPDAGSFFSGRVVPAILVADSIAVDVDLERLLKNRENPADAIDSTFFPVDAPLQEPDRPASFPKITRTANVFLSRLIAKQLPEIAITDLRGRVVLGTDTVRIYKANAFFNTDSLLFTLESAHARIVLQGGYEENEIHLRLREPAVVDVPLPEPFRLRGSVKEGFSTLRRLEDRFLFNITTDGLVVESQAIARAPLSFGQISLTSAVRFSRSSMDVQTAATVDELQFKHSFTVQENTSAPVIVQTVRLEPATMQEIKNSIPEAFLGQLSGATFEGRLGYALQMRIDFGALDSLQLDAEVIRDQFRLQQSGFDFQKLNGSFQQPVYDGLQIKRNVLIGTANPDYTPISQIPQILIDAVLTSEDVGFYRHRGFSSGAFRSAMIDNLRSQGFKRGASTISMQLVKNLYLTREKTIARKFQELVITWLLEESQQVSKDVMLEVYLNVIEWGPDVYGIGEASRYYFRKKPAQLTLEECLFLASIIPFPKRFHVRFRKGELRASAVQTMTFVARKMGQFGFIPEDAYANLKFDRLRITGDALQVIAPLDAARNDTLPKWWEEYR